MAHPNQNVVDANAGKITKIITTVIVVIVLLIVALNSFTTVKAGHSGVVTTFGKV